MECRIIMRPFRQPTTSTGHVERHVIETYSARRDRFVPWGNWMICPAAMPHSRCLASSPPPDGSLSTGRPE